VCVEQCVCVNECVSVSVCCPSPVQGEGLRLLDSCITQLKDQGPSRTCNESKKEEEDLELEAGREDALAHLLGLAVPTLKYDAKNTPTS